MTIARYRRNAAMGIFGALVMMAATAAPAAASPGTGDAYAVPIQGRGKSITIGTMTTASHYLHPDGKSAGFSRDSHPGRDVVRRFAGKPGAAVTGTVIVTTGSADHGAKGTALVSGDSKISRLTPAERAFADGVILDSLANSRTMTTAPIIVSAPPALSSLGRTLSAVKEMSPATVRPLDATAMRSAAGRRLKTLYTGGQLSIEEKKAQTTIARDMAPQTSQTGSAHYPVLDMGHGVSGIRIEKVTGLGDSMAISGRAVYWAVMGQVQPSGKIAWAEPMNTILLAARMSRVNGTWKIGSLSWSFAPGDQP